MQPFSSMIPLQSWMTHHKNNTHTLFCTCGTIADIQGNIEDIVCPSCGSDDYSFYDDHPQKIWKEFLTIQTVGENSESFFVDFHAIVPNEEGMELEKKLLLQMALLKEKRFIFDKTYISRQIFYYQLYNEDKNTLLSKLLEEKACAVFINTLLEKQPSLEWVTQSRYYQTATPLKRLEMLHFFFSTGYKEMELFFWNREFFEFSLPKVTTQKELLEFIANSTQKGIRKTLFQNYLKSIEETNTYNPFVDYLFSRIITNQDHSKKLYALHPLLKKELIRAYNYEASKEFIEFMLTHYSEKQIVEYFFSLTSTYLLIPSATKHQMEQKML